MRVLSIMTLDPATMKQPTQEEALELTRRFLDLVGDATCELHEVSTA